MWRSSASKRTKTMKTTTTTTTTRRTTHDDDDDDNVGGIAWLATPMSSSAGRIDR
jgi:hypothetical protein